MVARILQAKYYADSPFLETNLGNNPNYGWTSILAKREVLISDLGRRIENGHDTGGNLELYVVTLLDNPNPCILMTPTS